MSQEIKTALSIAWYIVVLYWIYSAVNTRKKARSENWVKRFTFYWLPLIIAALLLGPGEWFGHTFLREQFVPHSNSVGITGLILAYFGMLTACWSRYLLGKNWSVSVQLKEHHELITAGPYKYVRHPIYTGLLFLFTGNALIVGDWRGILAILIVFISFWYKLKHEERWLENYFGEKYTSYKQHTKALLPFVL